MRAIVTRDHIPITVQSERRFLSKLSNETDPCKCLLWMAYCNEKGYGRLTLPYNEGVVQAHRYMYARVYRQIPKDTLVCHTCDNPPCVNPFHLFLGTPKDNFDDMVSKGRAGGVLINPVRGERIGISRLTEKNVKEIRRSYAKGYTITEIGRNYGVHASTILRVVERTTWKHVA